MLIKSAVLAVLPFSLLLAQGTAAKKPAMEDYRYGLQGGLVFPASDTMKYFSDKKMGFSIGGQVTRDWMTPGQRLRARIDLTFLPKASVRSLNGSGRVEDDTVTGFAVGLDYLHFIEGKPLGFFLAGGLTLSNWKQDSSLTGAETSTNPGIALGAGWQFDRNLGLEARATWSRWSTNIRPETTHNAAAFSLQAAYRF